MDRPIQVRGACSGDAPAISRLIVETLRVSNAGDYAPAVTIA